MIPVTPEISVRPLQPDENEVVGSAVNGILSNTPYSMPMDAAMLHTQLYQPNPPTIYPVRMQRHARLCAWCAGRLEGFLDAAVGLDSESLRLPDYQPFGLIRFLILPTKVELVNEVAVALLAAAEQFWRQAGVAHVKAFHMSTGYPAFQAGVGVLPGDWPEHIRVLTTSGYYFVDRFYALRRPLDLPVEEVLPMTGLSLIYRGTSADRTYQLYRRAEPIGTARVTRLILDRETTRLRIANLIDLQIEPGWRRQNIGKWLLRRLINDASLQGYQQMLVHIAQHHSALLNLINQLGFIEENYRGYTLEKALTE